MVISRYCSVDDSAELFYRACTCCTIILLVQPIKFLIYREIFFVADVAVGDAKVLPCSQRKISPTD